MAKSIELNELPPTYENTAQLLGHPKIEVNSESRGLQCSNCGAQNHSSRDCTLPSMDKLLDLFGKNLCYDSSPAAVEKKNNIVKELFSNDG